MPFAHLSADISLAEEWQAASSGQFCFRAKTDYTGREVIFIPEGESDDE
jgi:hypothetical protein